MGQFAQLSSRGHRTAWRCWEAGGGYPGASPSPLRIGAAPLPGDISRLSLSAWRTLTPLSNFDHQRPPASGTVRHWCAPPETRHRL